MTNHPAHRRWVHHASAYRGKGTARFRLPGPARWALIILAALALILFFSACYLGRYMVYSRTGGRLVLPGAAETQVLEDRTLNDLVVVEEFAPARGDR